MNSALERAPQHRSSDQPIASVLSYLILFGGIATAVIALYLVVTCYTPLPWSDGWGEIALAGAGGKIFSLPELWQQHNEHRLLIPKLFLGLDLRLFDASQKLLLSVIFIVQLLHWLLLSWSMRALGGWHGPLWRSAAGLAALCLFCPTQWENLTWGFQTCFVLAPLFATASFVALLLHGRTQPTGGGKYLAVSVLAALAAVLSLANGLLVLPLLLFAAIALHMKRTVVLTYAVAALLITAIYFHDYSRPVQNADPLSSLSAPIKLASYTAAYFGSSWTAGNSWDDHNLRNAPYIGLCGFAVLLGFMLGSRRMPARDQTLSAELLMLATFCVGTAFLTALGRAASGNSQAFSSRYQTVALLFWFSLGCLSLQTANQSSRRFAFLTAQVVLLLVLIRGAILVHLPLRDAREHGFQQRATAAALLTGVDDNEQIARSYPDPDYARQLVPILREKRLSIFAGRNAVGMPIEAVLPIAEHEACQGDLQSIAWLGRGESRGLRITGWAWDSGAQRPPTGILAVSNGRVVGMGASGDWRPQIRARRRYMNTSFIGFTAYARTTTDAPVAVYAVLPGSRSRACEIANVPR